MTTADTIAIREQLVAVLRAAEPDLSGLSDMAAGAVLFRERIDRLSGAAIALAAVGVAIQTVALGHVPIIGLTVGWAYFGETITTITIAGAVISVVGVYLASNGRSDTNEVSRRGQKHAFRAQPSSKPPRHRRASPDR